MAVILNVDIHVNDDGSLAIRKVSEEAKKAESSTQSLKKSTDGLSNSFGSLKSTLATVGIGALAVEAVKTADSMNLLDARLKLATSSLEEFTNQQKELFSVSKSSYSELKGITDLYIKLDPALKRLGASTQAVNAVTASFAKGLQVGGAGAQESASAILQFSQAMGSGVLRGQEFNAIAEASPKLMKYMAEGMNVPITSMRQMAEDGKLTADVVSISLLKMSEDIENDFKTLPVTMGKAFTNIKTDLSKLSQEFDKTSGTTKYLSDLMINFSDSIYEYSGAVFTSLNDVSYIARSSMEDIFALSGEISKLLEVFNDASKEGSGLGLFKTSLLGLKVVIDTMYVGLNNSIVLMTELAKSGKNLFEDNELSKDFLTRVNSQILTLDDLEKKYIETYRNISKVQEGVKKPKQEEINLDLETEIKNMKAKGKILKEEEDRKKQAKTDEEKAQKASIKLAEEWAKRKKELSYEIAEAEQDVLAKPYIELEKKYNEDLDKYGKNKGAKALIDEAYYSKVDALNKKTIEDFNKKEEEKNKKAAEWQVKLFEANEKINDQIIAQREKMYGATSEAQIEAWYQNQLEWLGKLSLEGKATSEELQALLDKINGLKELKLKEQTISFKLEKSFYNSFENSLTSSIENAFNGDGLNLKSFFDNIKKNLTNTLAGSISSGIVNNFKTYTGFGTSDYAKGLSLLGSGASLVGTTVSASELAGIMNSGGKFDSATNIITTAGGTALRVGENGTGTVSSTGSDALSILNGASSIKTAYGMLTDGISGSILSGFNSVGNFLGNAGFGSLGSGVSQFGAGFASPLSFASESPMAGLYGSGIGSASGATMAGGMLSSGLIGYGIGTIGDKLFGAKTQAANLAAVGATIGSIVPGIGTLLGAAIGAVVGGFFGSTKVTGTRSGVDVGTSTAMDSSGQYYSETDYKKKSWFSSKSWTDYKYKGFSDTEIDAIKKTIGVYDYLLTQLGEYNDLVVSGGRFSSLQTFLDTNVVKAFLGAINPNNLDTIYQSWVNYAAEIDKTVTEAISSAVSGYVTEKRSFTEWKLGSGTIEQLKFTSDYLKTDFDALASSMGASTVTVDNFLSMYDKAIKENFTQDTIDAWKSLGDALINSTDSAKAYTNAIKQSNETVRQNTLSLLSNKLTGWVTTLGAVQNAIDNLNPSFKTFSELASTSIALDNYSAMLSDLDKTRQNEINSLTTTTNIRLSQLNNEKTLFQNLSSLIDELNLKLIGANVTSDYFFNELSKAKATLASGGVVDSSKLSSSANSYLESALQKSSSQLEYFREVAKVREGIGSLGGMVTGGSLESIEAAITSEEATLAFKLDQLNKTATDILNGWKGQSTTAIDSVAGQIGAINNDVVSKAYSEVLGRTADTGGYAYWTDQIAKGNLNESNIKEAIANAALSFNPSTYTGDVPSNIIEQSIENAKNWIDGSHASGLDYVPFDGYRAELHRGERVQTASEVQKDSIILELKNEIKNLREITLKNAAETTRMSKIIDRVCPDGDALQVRITA